MRFIFGTDSIVRRVRRVRFEKNEPKMCNDIDVPKMLKLDRKKYGSGNNDQTRNYGRRYRHAG